MRLLNILALACRLGLMATALLTPPSASAAAKTVAKSAAASFPLDPLSADEIRTTVATLKAAGDISGETEYPLIRLHEPPKAEILDYKPGSSFRREAFVIAYDRKARKTFEGVVDLRAKRVLAWTERPSVQPPIVEKDANLATDIVRADPRWREAMRKRGITNFDGVEIRALSAGYYGDPDEDGRRMLRCVSFLADGATNILARPIEGVIAHVDLTEGKVARFVDAGILPVPRDEAEYDARASVPLRTPPKPLVISQPEGPSFQVQGQEVRWQNWRFRFALDPREGLAIYTVGYEDRGRLRSILYRASLSEMLVAYGDASEGWYWRNILDEGENMLGWTALSLEPGADAPQNAVYFGSTVADEKGAPQVTPRAVALYERDGGLLWKHADYGGRNDSRRARELVISCITTIGNYDYGFNWVFRQDGTLEQETLLTGIMTTKGVARASDAEADHAGTSHGHLVMPYVEAVHHQHFFNFRLDLDVDGAENSVVEQNAAPAPAGPENRYGGVFAMTDTLLRTERAARRLLDLGASRRWRVINPGQRNALGQPTGYTLLPGENIAPLALPDAWIRKRGAFVDAHLWVTRENPEELHAAGDFPNQSRGGDGLPAFAGDDQSLDRQDVVLWYTMGTTHIPRPEDWPVMPVHRMGFKLVPTGFFGRNPALDVPPVANRAGKKIASALRPRSKTAARVR